MEDSLAMSSLPVKIHDNPIQEGLMNRINDTKQQIFKDVTTRGVRCFRYETFTGSIQRARAVDF